MGIVTMERRDRSVRVDGAADVRVTAYEFGEEDAGGRWRPVRWRVSLVEIDRTLPPGHSARERRTLSPGLDSMLEVGRWLAGRGLTVEAIGPAMTRAARRAAEVAT